MKNYVREQGLETVNAIGTRWDVRTLSDDYLTAKLSHPFLLCTPDPCRYVNSVLEPGAFLERMGLPKA